MPSTTPWWLPADWQVLGLSVLAGMCVTQVWKGWHFHKYGARPHNWLTRGVAMVVTVAIITVVYVLDGVAWTAAIRVALLWGLAQPLLYMLLQRLVRKHAPYVASALGEQRRRKPRDASVWTEEQRKAHRHSLFGDTEF